MWQNKYTARGTVRRISKVGKKKKPRRIKNLHDFEKAIYFLILKTWHVVYSSLAQYSLVCAKIVVVHLRKYFSFFLLLFHSFPDIFQRLGVFKYKVFNHMGLKSLKKKKTHKFPTCSAIIKYQILNVPHLLVHLWRECRLAHWAQATAGDRGTVLFLLNRCCHFGFLLGIRRPGKKYNV